MKQIYKQLASRRTILSFILVSFFSMLVGIIGTSDTTYAATCTFSLNEAKTEITKRCDEGGTTTMKNTSGQQVYKRTYPALGAACTEQVQLTSGTSGTHKVFYGKTEQTGLDVLSTNCKLVSIGQVSITTSGGSGTTSIRSALNDIINKNCNSQPNGTLRSECAASWQTVIDQCNTSERNKIGSDAYKNSMAKCIAQRKSYNENEIKNALKNIDKDIANLDKIEECRKQDKEYSEDLKKCVEICEDGQALDDDGKCVDTTSCAIEGIGWIICPATLFIGQLNDALWGIVEQFLTVSPSIFREGGDTLRAWEAVRNIANVVFVIAFLIIIYSQITGAGITNYGIKKLLPKLVVTAILVNISFWICAIAVDVSNIIGSGLYSLLQNIVGGTSTQTGLGAPVGSWSDVTAWLLAGGAGALAIGGATIAIGAYGVMGALALLLPGALIALLAFITVVVLLIARQAFIIILVVIAPLAFVAYLLPNTNQWFSRWRKFLMTLLIMYPSIALLFGGSELAAAVIRAAKPDDGLIVIASLVITAVPLFALPALMKAAGGVMSRIGGVVNNPARGPIDRLKKQGERYRQQQKGFRMGENLKRTSGIREGSGGVLGRAGSIRRRAATKLSGIGNANTIDAAQKDIYSKAASESEQREYVAQRALAQGSNYAAQVGGSEGAAKYVKAYAIQAKSDELEKDIKAAQLLYKEKGRGMDKDSYKAHLEDQIGSESTEMFEKRAAMREFGTVANADAVNKMADSVAEYANNPNISKEDKADFQREFVAAFKGDGRMPVNFSATNASEAQTGDFVKKAAERIKDTVQGGKLNASHFGKMDIDEMRRWNTEFSNDPALLNSISSDKIDAVHKAIEMAENDPRINVNFGDRERKALDEMKKKLETQFMNSVQAKTDQDAAARTYGPNI